MPITLQHVFKTSMNKKKFKTRNKEAKQKKNTESIKKIEDI